MKGALTMNKVNADNFNDTCQGYVKRALSDCNTLTDEQKKEVMRNLYWAFDFMTMQDARNYQ